MHARKQPYTTLRYAKAPASAPPHVSTCTWSNTVPSSTTNMLRMASMHEQRTWCYIYHCIPSKCPRQARCPPPRSATSNRPEESIRQFRGTIHSTIRTNRANHTNTFYDDDETGKNAPAHKGSGCRESPAALLRRGFASELDGEAHERTLWQTSRSATQGRQFGIIHPSTRYLASCTTHGMASTRHPV